MLILSRKENEKIRIGNDIVLNIISISENNVKIGIDASPDVKVYREEIYELIKIHNTQASANTDKKLIANLKQLKINKLNKHDEKK